jgi:hypothetical protein
MEAQRLSKNRARLSHLRSLPFFGANLSSPEPCIVPRARRVASAARPAAFALATCRFY